MNEYKVGQVWRDMDIRTVHAEKMIVEIVGDTAICESGGRKVKIKLRRRARRGA